MLVILLAFAALGCGPPGPPTMTPDAGTTPDAGMTVGGVRLVVAVRLSVEGELWESLEPPIVAEEFRLEELSLHIVAARSPSDRVDLPVPQSASPTRLDLVRGPRDLELLGASPATYGRAILDLAPSATDEPSIVLRAVRGDVTYLLESRRSLTIDARCGGDAVQLDPDMLGVLRVSLEANRLVDPLPEIEPGGVRVVLIDATHLPEVLEAIEDALAEAWELDCTALDEEPGAGPSRSSDSPDTP